MSRFHVVPTPLDGLCLVERVCLGDDRGFLARLFCADDLRSAGWCWPVRQINHTYTAEKGTVRGLHYQVPPKAEAKLVSCLRGAVWDVAVDLRRGSPTFLRWHAQELSAENRQAMLIPPGFAHGFQALAHDCELLYLHSEAYDPTCEAGLRPGDPALAIGWPLKVVNLSARDAGQPELGEAFPGLSI